MEYYLKFYLDQITIVKYNAKQATVTNISNIESTFSYSDIGTTSERGFEQISFESYFLYSLNISN